MRIDQEKMEEALQFLSESDEEYASLRALVQGLDRQTRTIKAIAFERAREGSAAAKEQAAYASIQYREHLQKIELAERECLILQERRNTAVTTIDCWRSLNAARNRGMM